MLRSTRLVVSSAVALVFFTGALGYWARGRWALAQKAPAPPAPASLQSAVFRGPVVALSASAALPAPRAAPALCPADMVLVEGQHCSDVAHHCRRWLDDEKLPFARCAEYDSPARCTGTRKGLRYCIDRHEYTRPAETLPVNHASFVEASRVCAGLDKRVCTEDEWVFACEGEEMRPYPYGFSRAPVCNQDRDDLYEMSQGKQVLRDHRHAPGSHPECKSPFGVYDMAGNLDEPVLRESQRHAYPFRNALKGGWWMAARNRCRPATTAHDDHYKDIQIGVRCCRDARD